MNATSCSGRLAASAQVVAPGRVVVDHRSGLQHRGRSLTIRAQASLVPPPAGVTLPKQQPVMPAPTFGFVANAEKINSRACMLGFFALIAVEAIAHRGLLEMLGLKVGSGLGFEL
ncbi:hypothetical protein V8C86DRAFT_2901426 [Haematococcus lacustris]|nr:hypothetical protein QJQ45_000058 [Haematococcus lacustris]